MGHLPTSVYRGRSSLGGEIETSRECKLYRMPFLHINSKKKGCKLSALNHVDKIRTLFFYLFSKTAGRVWYALWTGSRLSAQHRVTGSQSRRTNRHFKVALRLLSPTNSLLWCCRVLLLRGTSKMKISLTLFLFNSLFFFLPSSSITSPAASCHR